MEEVVFTVSVEVCAVPFMLIACGDQLHEAPVGTEEEKHESRTTPPKLLVGFTVMV